MDPLTLTACLPLMLNAIAWGAKQAPDAATAAQSIAAAAESGASLLELVTKAKSVFTAKPRQGVLLRRCLLITGLAVRAAQEVAPPATKAKRAALEAEVKLAWDVCAATVPDPEDEAALGNALNDWLAPPLSTPWGRALWGVLARRQTKKRGPTLASAEERRAFERRFMAAWSLNTSAGEGEALEREVRGLRALDAARLREQLVADLASWGGRHVFGNLRAGAELQGMPWMSLEAVYVEPEVTWEEEDEEWLGPALRTLWAAVQEHPLTLVTADMGLGKTLTARSFVLERALDWLEAKDAPGERWLPVYVRCADHLRAERTELEDLVAAAWMSQWEGLSGEKLRARDPRLSLPHEETRLVIVLDGLDEVHLSHDQVERLLRHLHDDECCTTLRVVVFSRPGAVPAREKLPKGARTLRVLPFEGAQINEWLGRWTELGQTGPGSMEQVDEDPIKDLLRTPVLLFMLAWTWHIHNGLLPSAAALYEEFLRKVARGKLQHDRERHPVISDASERVRQLLIELNHLCPDAIHEDAMLWVLGRVALAVHRREQTPNPTPFRRRDVENLLDEMLKLRGESGAIDLITLACVLALQADLRGDQPVMLFGHRSFQEYLVARAWREQLRRIVVSGAGLLRETEEAVLEGVLIQAPKDRTLSFLLELLQAEDQTTKTHILEWSQTMVSDLRVGPLKMSDHEAHADSRAPLALAAFAIGGTLSDERGFVLKNPQSLRRVVAWVWSSLCEAQFVAPRLTRKCNQDEWILDQVNLREAKLTLSDLSDVDLSGANLVRADLKGARLERSDLSYAKLSGANLTDAKLMCADLMGARLMNTTLSGAILTDVDLAHANLARSTLIGAVLFGADLTGAKLGKANLRGANLESADLSGASLVAADLSTAQNLTTSTLHNARFTLMHPELPDTLWPEDFPAEAAIAAGAIPNNPDGTWPKPKPKPSPGATVAAPPPEEDGDAT